MKAYFKCVLAVVLSIFSFGCAHNYYNIPHEQYAQRVKVLGVAPIFVDADSDIRHPEKDALVALIKDYDRINEKKLVDMIKESGSHFDVRFLGGDPDPLFAGLFLRREKRDDAGIFYNKYFYKAEALRDYVKSNNVDAVMLIVVSGLTRPEKVYSSNLLNYLDTNYNYLIMSAQILDSDGSILWEYPNFLKDGFSLPPLIALQYPDFCEAEANANEKVDVKFKTISGIKRTLQKQEKDLLRRNKQVSESYYTIFDDMVSLLDPGKSLFGGSK
jgi:hypothetical protein